MNSPSIPLHDIEVLVYTSDSFALEVDLTIPYRGSESALHILLTTQELVQLVYKWSGGYTLTADHSPLTPPYFKCEKFSPGLWMLLVVGGKLEILRLLELACHRLWSVVAKDNLWGGVRLLDGRQYAKIPSADLLAQIDHFLWPLKRVPPVAAKTRPLPSAAQLPRRAHPYTVAVAAHDENVTETVKLSKLDVSSIIGAGGRRISHIRNVTQCRITVLPITQESLLTYAKFRSRDFPQTISLTGTPEQICHARMLLKRALLEGRRYG